jgi:predicted Zn-dependent protease with MMP-like domain
VRPSRIIGAAIIALSLGLVAVSFWAPLPGMVAVVAVGVVVALGVATLTTGLAGWHEPASEAEFDAIVERAERMGREEDDDLWDEPDEEDWETEDLFDPRNEEDFQALVRGALDDLPTEFHRALEGVAVVVSDGGRRRRAYGLYHGDGVARNDVADRIVIYRDTLVRDFGHDPAELRRQVTRTVQHELAHHLGWGERGVRGLGL